MNTLHCDYYVKREGVMVKGISNQRRRDDDGHKSQKNKVYIRILYCTSSIFLFTEDVFFNVISIILLYSYHFAKDT
jgi:hypothetical protein